MTLKHNMVRLLVKGGAISPSLLLDILKIAKRAGNKGISFGSRQDIIFHLPSTHPERTLKELDELHIDFLVSKGNVSRRQNIVSSFAASDIFQNTHWLKSEHYLNILGQFSFPHLLRINISDPRQSLVPLFYGFINFVASEHENFWYLFLRLPFNHELKRWPVLVNSNDISVLSKAIECTWLNKHDIDLESLFESITENGNYTTKTIDSALSDTFHLAPDYEGFGRMHSSDKYWAGFYWRNNLYDIDFMEEMCELCLKTGISTLAITPWKSFIVKEIHEKNLIHWKALDGRYGITMRHSAFELNWHLPLANDSALKLKKYIVKKFDKQDVCVHGLTFGITTGYDLPFCSIMITEKPLPSYMKWLTFLRKYDIDLADRFDPNSCKYHNFITGCSHYRLPELLARATRLFYNDFIPEIDPDEHMVTGA